MNDSSLVEKFTEDIEAYLKEGQLPEAAALAISVLSSIDNDAVGLGLMLKKTWRDDTLICPEI